MDGVLTEKDDLETQYEAGMGFENLEVMEKNLESGTSGSNSLARQGAPKIAVSPREQLPGKKVCVVGGGFAGVYTALKLNHMSWKRVESPEITVIDPKDKFVLLPLLYEFATDLSDISEVAQPYSEIFAETPVNFIQDSVAGIDIQMKIIYLAEGEEVSYDFIVIAVGAEPVRDSIIGAKDHALSFYNLDDALELQREIRNFKSSDKEQIEVVIVGGSYSGVELACTLLDYFGPGRVKVVLLDRGHDILKTALPDNRRKAESVLIDGGIEITTMVQVDRIDEDGTVTARKMGEHGNSDKYFTLKSDLVIVTAGSRANSLLNNLNLEKDASGKIITDGTLLIKGFSDAFALGDNSVVEDHPDLLPTAQVAFQASEYAAWNIWATINGDRMIPFRYYQTNSINNLTARKPSLSPFGFGMKGPVGSLARRLANLTREPSDESSDNDI